MTTTRHHAETGTDDDARIRREFHEVVNMARSELKRWLATDESRSVGVTARGTKVSPAGAESVGHRSGRRIASILAKKVADLDDSDYAHMRKVVGYVRRHLAQRPEREALRDSRWRWSLMNWGHDPLKE